MAAETKGFAKVFYRFDTKEDGKISSDKLHAYFIGEAMSNTEAQSVIEEFDKTGDDFLEFEDSVKLMEQEGDVNEDLKRALRCLRLIRVVVLWMHNAERIAEHVLSIGRCQIVRRMCD